MSIINTLVRTAANAALREALKTTTGSKARKGRGRSSGLSGIVMRQLMKTLTSRGR